MTIEKAKDYVNYMFCGDCPYAFDSDCSRKECKIAMDVTIKALEKQIPKKPIFWHSTPCGPDWADDAWGYRCPCCGNEGIDYPDHHCVCGQAIDWSDNDDT